MKFRNILLGTGVLFMITGLVLMLVWFGAQKNAPAEPPPQEQKAEVKPEPPPAEILTAAHFIPAGTLLRESDLAWKKVGPGENPDGSLLKGRASEKDFLGAIGRRDLAGGEAILESEFVKPGDEKFFTSVLKPGGRAISIFVDPAQANAGLILPGDRVDVLLTQTFNDDLTDNNVLKLHYKNVVGETVLRNVRVIALDQTLNRQKAGATPAAATLPKTITLELFGSQPEKLMVASEMGKLQLAVLPLEKTDLAEAEAKHPAQAQTNRNGFKKIVYESKLKQFPIAGSPGPAEIYNSWSMENTGSAPVWSFKVSPALAKLIAIASLPPPSPAPPLPSSTGSTLENLIRRPIVPSNDSSSRAEPHTFSPKPGVRSPYYVEGRQ